jgi:hypothetical protein
MKQDVFKLKPPVGIRFVCISRKQADRALAGECVKCRDGRTESKTRMDEVELLQCRDCGFVYAVQRT